MPGGEWKRGIALPAIYAVTAWPAQSASKCRANSMRIVAAPGARRRLLAPCASSSSKIASSARRAR